jgi:Protein of unknown function (DUF3455)
MRDAPFTIAAVLIPSLFAFAAVGCGAPSAEKPGAAIASNAASLADTSDLAPPDGNELEFGLRGVGVQIYTCTEAATGSAWVFTAPEADLFDRHGTKVGKHYAGPTWESNDGSKVVGAKLAAATPDPTSIPWLLLKGASHAGHGRMDEVTFLQRLSTSGGNAPATGCDATNVGSVARVPYTASYCFFEGP